MRVLRWVSSLGRLLVAFALLAAVGAYTYYDVDRSTERADRRTGDQRAAAQADSYARAIAGWFAEGNRIATELGARVGGTAGDGAKHNVLNAHLSVRHEFGRELILVGTDNRAMLSEGAVTRDRAAFTPCEIDRQSFPNLVLEGRRGTTAPRRLHAPRAGCRQPRLAIAAPAGTDVLILLAAVEDAPVRFQGANERLELLAPGEHASPEFDEARTSETKTSRFERGDAKRLGAYAEVAEGWSLFLELDTGAVDGTAATERPAGIVARNLFPALIAAFILLALFDIRRRRAHERAEEAKRAFFATVGHELRTPLTVLKGYSETLASRWDALDDSARKMLIENLVPQTRRLGAVVEKLLFASNIQAQAYVRPKPGAVDVESRLRKVATDVAPLAPLHRFDVEIDPAIPDARADADALDRVLRELVDNAVKYSPSGGTVHLAARRVRRGIAIAVTDEGVGLPINEKQIFEPLVQGEGVDTRVHDEGGAGVGLYIVRTLVRDMGGTVRAERLKPKGTRFVVTLRANAGRPTPAVARS